MNDQRINIAIVSYNRPILLKKCLTSVMKASHNLETKYFVTINGFCPSSDLVLQEFPMVEKINLNSPENPSAARNKIIDRIEHGWICFLDDDVEVPENYFQIGLEFSKLYPEINIFGGPDVAPLKPTTFQLSLTLAQMTFLASAHTRYRHGAGGDKDKNPYRFSKSGEELILCNMWINSLLLQTSKIRFPPSYKRNEENVMIYHLKKQGYTFGFLRHMKVFHFKKNSFQSLYQAIISSSYYRTKSFFDFPDSFHPLYLIPSIFIIYLVSLIFRYDEIYIAPLWLYIFLSFSSSFFLVWREEKPYRFIGRVMILQVFINLSYGIGMLWALVRESALRLRQS